MRTSRVIFTLCLLFCSASAYGGGAWSSSASNATDKPVEQPAQPQAGTVPLVPIPGGDGFAIQPQYPSPYIQLPGVVPGRSELFQRDKNDLFGLTPDEIRKLRKELASRQEAASDAPSDLKSVTIPISLTPGTQMPTIRVTPGYVSSVVVLDKYGNPWPIKGVTWGNKEEYSVEPPPPPGQDTSVPQNIIAVTPLRSIGATSLSILLSGKSLPVVVRLVISKGVTDARADLRVDGLAPGASAEVRGSNIPDQFSDTDMVAFLDGVPPKLAERLKVNSDLVEAWSFKGSMIVRTKGNLVSPAWTGIEHGADDLRVYKTSIVPVLLVLSDGGTKMVTITPPEKNVFEKRK